MKNILLPILLLLLLLSCGQKTTPATPEVHKAPSTSPQEKTKGLQPAPITPLTEQLEEQLKYEEPEFHITYVSHTEKIYIVKNRMSHFKYIHEYPDNSPTATPSSTSTETVLKNYLLPYDEVEDFKNTIRNGFYKLDAAYGAPADQRHYPNTIKIQMDKAYHEVVFRSNPSFKSAPAAFKKVESILLQLSKNARGK